MSRVSEDNQSRMEQLSNRLRDADNVASELASSKLQLATTAALLRDARTELKVATMTGAYTLPSTSSFKSTDIDNFEARTRLSFGSSAALPPRTSELPTRQRSDTGEINLTLCFDL